jgi:hypothetical protein
LLGVSRPFAPTPLGAEVMIGIGVVAAVAGAAAMFFALMGQRRAPLPPSAPRVVRARRHPVVIALTSLLMGLGAGMAGVGVGALVGCTYTDLAGAPGQMTVTVEDQIHPRRGCDYFELREPKLMLHAICGTSAQFDASPAGSQLVLVGKSSPLGLDMQSFHAGQPADDGLNLDMNFNLNL